MRELRDSIRVHAPPERVWTWLLGLAEHYTEWHPDHVSARWVRGDPAAVGSVLEVVERLAGRREELRFEMTGVDPPRQLEYRILGPHSILLPTGGFEVAPDDEGSRFTAYICYRFGQLTEALFRRRVAALRAHMREEGQNLKRLIESAP